ncbi:MAG: hypothetical protein JW969_12880 [Spirochaetales bacterium]|nr:hypothetical protein [Spirochaetales bacterium]
MNITSWVAVAFVLSSFVFFLRKIIIDHMAGIVGSIVFYLVMVILGFTIVPIITTITNTFIYSRFMVSADFITINLIWPLSKFYSTFIDFSEYYNPSMVIFKWIYSLIIFPGLLFLFVFKKYEYFERSGLLITSPAGKVNEHQETELPNKINDSIE